jgi:hypothetical protein
VEAVVAGTVNEELAQHLARIKALVNDLSALKGFRSVHWEELETEMRRAADELHRLGDLAKVWKL